MLWKLIWLLLATAISTLFGFWLATEFSDFASQGPDLAAGGPILLLAVLRAFWSIHSATVAALVISAAVLWLVLEAAFRGGRRNFWIYLGSGAARVAVLGSTGMILSALASRDESGGSFVIAAAVVPGLWFIVTLLETAIRRDAVDVMAADFPSFAAVIAAHLLLELVLAAPLWLILLKLWLGVSNAEGILVTGAGTAATLVLWTVVHSYLIAVRYSTIDIMRRNVVDG